MSIAYFTFGQNHVHAIDGVTYDRDCVVKIDTTYWDVQDPRDVMFQHFGNKWAMQYDEQPDMRQFPRGVMELC